MRSTGIVRKIDELGRIVLPVELRRTLDIEERDEMEIYLDDDKIVLCKRDPSCVFCGSGNQLVSYMGKHICRDCADHLGKA